jgi:thioredoxin reductase (NADPH)
MESAIIWIIMGLVIAAIIFPYFIKFRKQQKLDLERKREAESLGLNKPRGQYPLIDATFCIGCGSCVRACPEEDVLGVVFGKAMVINGVRCVGHGYCEVVCPVGAIKVGLGNIKTRPDIPQLDEFNQTSVPGIYIAGELGGLSLIRNAIEQGQKVIEKIAKDGVRSTGNGTYDVVIVGAGPAGISAALTAIKNRLSYLLIDQQNPGGTILQYPRRKLVMSQPVQIPLYGWMKKEEVSKEDLLAIWQKILIDYKINIKSGEKVEKIGKDNGCYKIITQNGTYTACQVVLSMGRRGTPRKLGVIGEDSPKVFYQLIDAQSFTSLNLLVVGGGDSAVEAAIGLARQGDNKVTISYRQGTFAKVKKKNEDRVNELIAQKKLRPLFKSELLEIQDKKVRLRVGDDIMETPNDYVFIFIGGEPPFNMLKEIGIAMGGEEKLTSAELVS